MFYFFVNGEHSPASGAAFKYEADSLGRALLGQVDQVLPHIRMPVQVVDDIAITALGPRPGLQLRVEVRMPLQVLVDGMTDSLIARGIRTGCARQRQRDYR
ncbi:hypothetical protein A5791_18865 [Mycobacterium sp. 852002-51163_SCH5372311]|nr:hypothetical protein A5791_18865 [Mycobacterium sp. 852002-51163_SCH5372311]